MSGDLSNNMRLESHVSDEQHAKLDDEELFAVLDIKDIIGLVYRKVTPEDCANALEKHKILFNGELGLYPHNIFKLKVKLGAIPVHKKVYQVLFKQQPVFKDELMHLLREKNLCKCGATNWASPMFIQKRRQTKMATPKYVEYWTFKS